MFDPRAATPLVSSHAVPGRVYSMDTDPKGARLVVAMAERNVSVYDVRKMEEPEQRRESALKYMTRRVACMADGKGASDPSSHAPSFEGLRNEGLRSPADPTFVPPCSSCTGYRLGVLLDRGPYRRRLL